MFAATPDLVLAPVDSVRVVSHVYSVSLLALVPMAVAGLAAWALRRSGAGMRALVWRASMLALLIVCIGQLLPSRWGAWVIPPGLAEPLIALGRLELAAGGSPATGGAWFVEMLCYAYLTGVALVLLSLVRSYASAVVTVSRATPVLDAGWRAQLDAARAVLGITRQVRMVMTDSASVPMIVGALRPVVVLPPYVLEWSDERRCAVLLHELAHVRARDVAAAIAGRVVCALLWFHPGAWWVARTLHDEAELACDDRVLAARVKPSAYADLLLAVSDRVHGRSARGGAVALTGGGLRARLASIVSTRRESHAAPTRRAVATAFAMALCLATPLSAVRLEPTRDVLRGLMHDSRWDSRAYAVLGLAPRADSVNVARAAAVDDPDPLVRAWASYALALRQAPVSPLPPRTQPR